MTTADTSPNAIPVVLVVGGADTGRAPIAAALLQRMLAQHEIPALVASTGVTGHDGEPPEPEARDTMTALGLDISSHRARSITPEQVQHAHILIAIDRGIAHVLRQYYPAARASIITLGELSGTGRDIPDPFRMQIGAWLSYAREIQTLLQAGLPTLHARLHPPTSPPPPAAPAPQPEPAAPAPTDGARTAPLQRLERIVQTLHDMPDLLDWQQVQRQIISHLNEIAAHPTNPPDLAPSYTALLITMLHSTHTTPPPDRVQQIQQAIARLHTPIVQPDLSELAGLLSQWQQTSA